MRSAEKGRFLPAGVETAAPGDLVEPVDLLVDTDLRSSRSPATCA